jgi:hypothetical protein
MYLPPLSRTVRAHPPLPTPPPCPLSLRPVYDFLGSHSLDGTLQALGVAVPASGTAVASASGPSVDDGASGSAARAGDAAGAVGEEGTTGGARGTAPAPAVKRMHNSPIEILGSDEEDAQPRAARKKVSKKLGAWMYA